jgi:hypothetical protein
MDNFTNDIAGQSDYILSPYISFLNAVSPIELSFNVAYAQYSLTLNNIDSLIVSASTDCGETWTRLYSNGGTNLSTAGTGGVNGAFVPTGSQWRTELINLNAYIGETDVRIRFQNKSGWGNNMYLDDININTNALSLDENNSANSLMNVFPNPALNEVNIELKKFSGNEAANVYDLTGRLILSEQFSAEGKIQLSTRNWSNGLYIIEVQSGSNFSRTKLIVQHN